MAGNEEKTEQATPRRRQEAREQGQVPKSMDLSSTFGLLVSILALQAFGYAWVEQWELFARQYLPTIGNVVLNVESLSQLLLHVMLLFGKIMLPFLGVLLLAGVTANILQTGFIFSTKALAFNFSRMNPFEGITRMFSQRSAVELLKACLKFLLIGYVIYSFLRQRQADIIGLILLDPPRIGGTLARLCFSLMFKTLGVLVVIAIGDYIFQRWQFEKNLRMSKQDLKEEYKRTEGDPLIKARVRQRQREMARRRMMSDVAKATVVITNPTHFAIALRYEPGEMAAPRIVAKGQRLLAAKIKELAAEHHIPIVENKPLARALFDQCEVGETIPAELFQAVAEIIAFIYRQSGRVPQT